VLKEGFELSSMQLVKCVLRCLGHISGSCLNGVCQEFVDKQNLLTYIESLSLGNMEISCLNKLIPLRPTPVASRSKACICGRSNAGTAALNPTSSNDVCLSVASFIYCEAEDSATGRSLV
jgi:hypothetical protein